MATRPYNPAVYVPGGASSAVARAIQAKGYSSARRRVSPYGPGYAPGFGPILQDPGVTGQTIGDYSGIPTTYTQGGQTIPLVPPTDTTTPTTPPPPTTPGAPERPPFDFNTDPGYLAALAAEQAGGTQLEAGLRAARERALVQFGDPSLAGAFGIGDLSPLTAAMTQQATTSGVSTLAGLQRQRDLSQQGIVNSLAAHGIIRSGDLGYRTGQNEQNYGSALYNAQQGVLDTLASSARDVAQQKGQLHTGVVNALTGAYNTYVNNPQYWGLASSPAPTDTTTPPPPVPEATSVPPAPPLTPARLPTGLPPASRVAPSWGRTQMDIGGNVYNRPGAPPVRRPASRLVNPYTTGQKRFG